MKQFIKFGLVGVLSTCINYGTFMLLSSLGLYYLIAYMMGFILSTFNAFCWGNWVVFKEDKTKVARVWWKSLLKVYAVYVVGFLVSSFLMWLWVDIVHLGQYFLFLTDFVTSILSIVNITPSDMTLFLSKTIGFCIDICITLPINFMMNKLWAYRQKEKVL